MVDDIMITFGVAFEILFLIESPWTLTSGPKIDSSKPEAIFLVECDPPMNKLWAT